MLIGQTRLTRRLQSGSCSWGRVRVFENDVSTSLKADRTHLLPSCWCPRVSSGVRIFQGGEEGREAEMRWTIQEISDDDDEREARRKIHQRRSKGIDQFPIHHSLRNPLSAEGKEEALKMGQKCLHSSSGRRRRRRREPFPTGVMKRHHYSLTMDRISSIGYGRSGSLLFNLNESNLNWTQFTLGMRFGCLPPQQTRLAPAAAATTTSAGDCRHPADARIGAYAAGSGSEGASRERLSNRRILRRGGGRRRTRTTNGPGREVLFADREPRLGGHNDQSQ